MSISLWMLIGKKLLKVHNLLSLDEVSLSRRNSEGHLSEDNFLRLGSKEVRQIHCKLHSAWNEPPGSPIILQFTLMCGFNL